MKEWNPVKRTRWRSGAAVFLISALFTSVFFINFCDWVFACGCTWLWAGADAHCNIHQPGSRHCPWCAHNPLPVYVAILAAQGWFSSRRWNVWRRLAASLTSFPVVGGWGALLYGWRSGYWS